jgi:GNAT superfamily N-acetyltransferase
MNVCVRKGVEGDIEVLVMFLRHLFAIEKDFSGNEDAQRAGLRLLLKDPRTGTIFVAETSGHLVGMVTAQIVVSTSVGGYSILLEDMFVAAGFRRKGIGSKLLQQVLSWGSERDAFRIQLVAAAGNAGALDFYRHAGLLKSDMIALYGRLYTITSNPT